MKPYYILFAWDQFYPRGGSGDIIHKRYDLKFASVQEAKDFAYRYAKSLFYRQVPEKDRIDPFEWFEITEVSENGLKVVSVGEFTDPFSDVLKIRTPEIIWDTKHEV